MQIQLNTANSQYVSAGNQKKTTIYGGQLKQSSVNPEVTSLQKQIQETQKNLQKLNEDTKLSSKERQTKAEEIQKEIQNLQEALRKVQQAEEQKKQEEAKQKREAEKPRTEQEQERKVEELKSEALMGIASASNGVAIAQDSAHEAQKLLTKMSLGKGSKYKGNLSLGEVQALGAKASSYLKDMGKAIKSVNADLAKFSEKLTKAQSAQAEKVSKAYKEHMLEKNKIEDIKDQVQTVEGEKREEGKQQIKEQKAIEHVDVYL